MKIRLLKNWKGRRAGEVITVGDHIAATLHRHRYAALCEAEARADGKPPPDAPPKRTRRKAA